MKFVHFTHEDRVCVGVIDVGRDQVQEIRLPDGADQGAGILPLIQAWSAGGDASPEAVGAPVALSDVTLLAPIPNPGRNIFCVGKNYQEHAAEFAASGFDATGSAKAAAPEFPIFFTKPGSSVVGPGAEVDPHGTLSSALDYEAELAVIIGRGGRGIPVDEVWDHVWGYTLINDVTARDLQQRHKQWFLGKSLDTFCPMGPWAVTADEVDGANLTIECTVNGELRQKASTADLIFDIPTLVATLSAGITLHPGDIIATGTPAGVGIGFDPPRFLGDGDVVEVRGAGLGSLRNPIATPRSVA